MGPLFYENLLQPKVTAVDDCDGEKRLEVNPGVIGTDAGVVGPGGEGADKCAEHLRRDNEDGGDEGTGPSAAQIREF